jgi:3-deoxy-D-manno-octulosonate 8-phosphate phosphatase (KDO 8-P phosphatase)
LPVKKKSKRLTRARLANIKLVILDVDGVMTDGRMVYGANGLELKFFDVYDGFGISRAIEKGLHIAVISRGESDISLRRTRALGITDVVQRSLDKLKTAEEMMAKYRITASEVCFIGDDEYDLGLLRAAGISAAPHTAYPPVLAEVDLVTKAAGGRGAVREVLDLILKAKKLI